MFTGQGCQRHNATFGLKSELVVGHNCTGMVSATLLHPTSSTSCSFPGAVRSQGSACAYVHCFPHVWDALLDQDEWPFGLSKGFNSPTASEHWGRMRKIQVLACTLTGCCSLKLMPNTHVQVAVQAKSCCKLGMTMATSAQECTCGTSSGSPILCRAQ